MIFVGGVHGVGKTYFCERLKEAVGIKCYSASRLIEEKKNEAFEADKKTVDIVCNQNHLLAAVEELQEQNPLFVLDGHFCLLDKDGTIIRISEQLFMALKPEAIVLLIEEPEIIVERRMNRDGIKSDVEVTRRFQEEEAAYAEEISDKLGIPFRISKGLEELQSTICFIKAGGD